MAARTVATLTPSELETFRASLRAGTRRRSEAGARRRELAWRVAREAARRLRSEFGATEVWLFGSLARDAAYDEHSDIDLAVAGTDSAKYLDAVSMVLGLDRAFLVDLVRVEDASAGLLEAVKADGVEL